MTESTKPPVEITESTIEDLRAICQDEKLTLYAILDACDEPRVPAKVNELGEERAVILYSGAARRDYWAFAPYLVSVDEELLDWIIENLWEDPWGIFTAADHTLDEMRKHFRKFLLVEGPDGEELYFRFYDPRVLENYLNIVNVDEAGEIIGPASSFYLYTNKRLCCIQLDRS